MQVLFFLMAYNDQNRERDRSGQFQPFYLLRKVSRQDYSKTCKTQEAFLIKKKKKKVFVISYFCLKQSIHTYMFDTEICRLLFFSWIQKHTQEHFPQFKYFYYATNTDRICLCLSHLSYYIC